jgi:hypothetical protein
VEASIKQRFSNWFHGLLFDPEDGNSIFSRNFGKPPADYTTIHAQTKVLFRKTISKECPLPVGKGRYSSRSECVASTSLFFFRTSFNDADSNETIASEGRMINKYGAICGMKIGRGNTGSQRQPSPVPVFHHPTYSTNPKSKPRSRVGKPATNRLR